MKKPTQWEPPPLNPRSFHDPFKKRKRRATRRTVTKALKTLQKYYVSANGE